MRPRSHALFLVLPLVLSRGLLACGDEAAAPAPADAKAEAGAAQAAPSVPAEAAPAPAEAEPVEPAQSLDAEPAEDAPPPPPAPESLTVHALASYVVVTIYQKPDMSSTKLGYLRFGHRTMVTPKLEDQGEGCRKGWYQLPAGGFACASKGLLVDADKAPYMHQPPPRPRIDEPMPYDYGIVARDGTEMWWRPADALERELAAEKFALQQAKEQAAADAQALADGKPPRAKPDKPSASKPDAAQPDAAQPAAAQPDAAQPDADAKPGALPGLDDIEDSPAKPETPLTPEQIAEQKRREAEAKERAEQERLREQEERKLRLEKMGKLPLHQEHPFLEKGFMITMALKTRDKGRTWWRTSRGGYLESGKIYRKGTPKVMALGAEIPEDSGFPFGFVGRKKGAPVFEKDDADKLRRVGTLEQRSFVDGVEEVTIGDRDYLRTAEDKYLRVSDLRLAAPQTPPEELGGVDRWIDVELAQQLLVAYEGERPVFTTLVSTGRKGTEEEPFDTPTGTFRIQTKHISSSMDGNTASDGNYSIQDVPWAMFFHGSYALHGAFWHGGFGSRRSHGCVNLAPADARWLFWWAAPALPEGWHGAAAREDVPGSVVVVR